MEGENLKSALEEERALYETADTPPVEVPPAATSAEAVSDPAPAVAEPAVEPAATEPPAEPKPEPKEPREPKVVPLAALLEERDKRQQAEQALAVERARLEERARQQPVAQTGQQTAQPQTIQDAIKSRVEQEIGQRPPVEGDDADPIAAAEYDRLFESKQSVYLAQHAQQVAEATQLQTYLDRERTEFKAAKPDYDAALNHLVEQRKKFYLRTPGIRKLPEAQREAAAMWWVNYDAGRLIQDARENGVNVAQTIYDLAMETGYQGPAPASVTERVVEQPKPPTAAEKLETIAEGQKITSLDRGGHAGTTMELTDSQIDNMSQSDLSAWLQNPKNAARYRRMLGQE